jgi:SiaC family regulatory phosphoprotein
MDDILIQQTEDTPEINFSAKTGLLKFAGRAYSNEINAIFVKLNAWLDEYLKNPNDSTTITLQLDYSNTVFNRLVFEFIKKSKAIIDLGKNLHIKWYHYKDDEDSIDSCALLSKVINMKIETIELD